jgi:alcohol dehydrogenase
VNVATSASDVAAKLFTPAHVVAIDDDVRLERARELGADVTINNGSGTAVEVVMQLTDGLGADVAIEAVGMPETFELCAELVRPGCRVANVGVHGHPATLHLERLWIRDVTIPTGLVDTFTTPRLLKLIAEGRLGATPFASHRFTLGKTMDAYDTFAEAARTHAIKVVLEAAPTGRELIEREEALVGRDV